ncbi:S41 family peptidase [Pseudotenacibaculum haliotis]|uniref:S41 family peptidase n=1 Tax=Pseudotenacibaculum haliotis TaxID=1862138 RepID=A0ABW5LVL4_9FLAO
MKKALVLLLGILLSGNVFSQTELPNTLSKADKVYGLSKYWNEVNFNFAYLNKVDKEKWNSDYKSLIEKVQETKNDYEYYLLLQQFAVSLKDGHTNIFLPPSFSKFMLDAEFGDYKFTLRNIEGKAIITEVNKSKRKEIPLGTEIIEVNGLTTKEHLAKHVEPIVAYSTEDFRDAFSVRQMFYQPKGTTFDLKFRKPNGKIISRKLTISPAAEKEMHTRNKNEGIFEFKWLENKTAYVALHSFGEAKIDSLFKSKLPEIKKAKGLIIDLRENLGGSSEYGYSILGNLIHDDELIVAKSLILDYNPLYEYFGVNYNIQAKDTAQGSPQNRMMLSRAYLTAKDSYFYEIPFSTYPNRIEKSDRVVIPIAVLTGPFTASSSEDFLVAADNQKHIVKIGEATAGTTGMPMSFELPGGGWARICFKKEVYVDGREFVGYGIQPDIKVSKTLKDFIEKKDPAIEKALKYLRKA